MADNETTEVTFDKEVSDEWLAERGLSAGPEAEEPHELEVTATVDKEFHECDDCVMTVDWGGMEVNAYPCDEHKVDDFDLREYGE